MITRLSPGHLALLTAATRHFSRADPGAAGFLNAPGTIALVATTDGSVQGWCWGYLLPRPDTAPMAYLHHLEVDEDHRRRGIGRALLTAFTTVAATEGATRMFLTTGEANTAARRLYEKADATPAAQGPTVQYWLPLEPAAMR